MRRMWHGGTLLAALVAAAIVAACTGGQPSPSPVPTPTPAPSAAVTAPPSHPAATPVVPTATPAPTRVSPPATPASSVSATPHRDPYVGSVVASLADEGLRVRSAPRVSDDSRRLEPLLPLGTLVYVLGGPVRASGYAWYEVAPLESRDLPTGWIASAGRDGTPWIERAAADCPPVPRDVTHLAALPPGVGPACFPRPITVRARLVSCNCDMDGSWHTPGWFFLGSGSPVLLVEPDETAPPEDMDDWFELNLDPDGEHPGDTPLDEVVEVTGVFDHPAAADCTTTEMDGEPVRTWTCRTEFAVTRLEVVGR